MGHKETQTNSKQMMVSEAQAHVVLLVVFTFEAVAVCVIPRLDVPEVVFPAVAMLLFLISFLLFQCHHSRSKAWKFALLLTFLPAWLWLPLRGVAERDVEAGWYGIDCAAEGGPGNITVPEGHVNFVLGVRWRVVQENYTALPQSGSDAQFFSFVAPIESAESGACQTQGPIFAACVSSENNTDLCSWDARVGQPNMRLLKASGVSGDTFWQKAVPNPQEPGSDVELTEHNVFQYNSISYAETTAIAERERSKQRLKQILTYLGLAVGWVCVIAYAAVLTMTRRKEVRQEKAAARRENIEVAFRGCEVVEVELDDCTPGPLPVPPPPPLLPVPPPVMAQEEAVPEDTAALALLANPQHPSFDALAAPIHAPPSRRAAVPTW